MKQLSCEEIAKNISGKLVGSIDHDITGMNRIEYARKGELTFLANPKFEKYLKTTNASCIIIPETVKEKPAKDKAFIVVGDPYHEFVKLLKMLESQKEKKSGYIHPTAIIGEDVQLSNNTYIGPYCIIGDRCKIGEFTYLHPRVTICDDVEIDDGTILYPNVVCIDNTRIGKNCIIHAGAIIGDDGFGYIERNDGSYEKVPQMGNVVIGNNVEIGSNTTIDRAMIGSTVIEDGCKIDNLVQIGHNVVVGENTAMAGQVGVAGSCKVGKRNRFGGQVGLAGHLETADDVILLSQSGVAKTVPEKGVYFGSPIKDRTKAFKIETALQQLPDVLKDFYKIKKVVIEKLNLKDFTD
ncbi:MAG: UDP-3-O-(3-hydroxymyristoyl)glucosamine N-acyltransferase [Ignavibacteria bacterium GWB2_35_12]|nr:MAG: UDP-3-O-(3-hydroxymyristoyl)glucosamine N-acyltransferase [Ignavibacteria bacterium GWA2_35_8]OGU38645.1 MAG: UDP-3-O-(3-hydroxymyristoyl)glucosamine N-acyltransferase [Ignavibacteria bacterium GWB2_35_12]OGU94023.1 MAG: UDP-3-O-(3-hydroxymyristoyl)glucosamine N-acyltransferase [Ignavibacteria bacterium RIFOXYA2_FULL_35_10]OGV22880.1 MAG: UDP-3-O-(3-hydroxymyristoyl)glucosamine N-acyltransferase [Ignavibacteria bacterium RIFOXYC2_FULL_35_21]